MVKRRYLSEIEDVQYMMDSFVDSVNYLFNKQTKQATGKDVVYVREQKSIFDEFVNYLYSFTDGKAKLSYEKIFNLITQIDKNIFKTPKMCPTFVDVINKIIAYYCSCKNFETTKYYQSIMYGELNNSYYKWISMVDSIKFKDKIKNADLFVSKIFTR